MNDRVLLGIVAIISILIMEMTALSLGFNGTTLLLALTGVSGIAGYGVKESKNRMFDKKV